jgi:hypothetical protein
MGVLFGLALMGAGCGSDAAARKSTYLQRGGAYYTAANYATAVIEFKHALQIDSYDLWTCFYLLAEHGQGHVFLIIYRTHRAATFSPDCENAYERFV